jgi:CheY-like chemotaxis protein
VPGSLPQALAIRSAVVQVSGLAGWQVAGRLRRELGAGVLLIAVSGYYTDEDRGRSLAAGFDHHLVKPAEPEDLLALLGLAR